MGVRGAPRARPTPQSVHARGARDPARQQRTACAARRGASLAGAPASHRGVSCCEPRGISPACAPSARAGVRRGLWATGRSRRPLLRAALAAQRAPAGAPPAPRACRSVAEAGGRGTARRGARGAAPAAPAARGAPAAQLTARRGAARGQTQTAPGLMSYQDANEVGNASAQFYGAADPYPNQARAAETPPRPAPPSAALAAAPPPPPRRAAAAHGAATCPLSTGGRTRRVQLVRGEGGGRAWRCARRWRGRSLTETLHSLSLSLSPGVHHLLPARRNAGAPLEPFVCSRERTCGPRVWGNSRGGGGASSPAGAGPLSLCVLNLPPTVR
jgi:hypothetical protein